MKVTVTQKDINRGQPMLASACPIALALERKTKRKWRVGYQWCGPWRGGGEARMPAKAATFARDFDHGRPVKPFAFELDWEPSGNLDWEPKRPKKLA